MFSTHLRHILLLVGICFCSIYTHAFTVVIDAGHGGKDPGALGARVQEKTLNLEVSKRVAQQIRQAHPDINVLLTRSTDVYLTLQERADFVNKNHADLFICIHTNAADNKSICGAETFVLGIDKLESNLDVAMRENAVMTLEDDYQTKYAGFDPKSVESYIMFEFMQDQYIDKSLQFASLVQQEFTGTLKRSDRGVRQAAFWVLHKSACPSVLVEMGFISNATEEKFLASEAGKDAIAKGIYTAFANYKRTLDRKAGAVQDLPTATANLPKTSVATPTENPQPMADTTTSTPQITKETTSNEEKPWEATTSTTEKPWTKDNTPAANTSSTKPVEKPIQNVPTASAKPTFRVQIFSVRNPLQTGDPSFKGLKNCKYTKDGAFYKYTYGEDTDYQKIVDLKKQLTAKFKDCFVVAFYNDKQITVKEALQMAK